MRLLTMTAGKSGKRTAFQLTRPFTDHQHFQRFFWGGGGGGVALHSRKNPQPRPLPGKLASIWRRNPLCEVEKATTVRDIRHLLRPQMITSGKAPLNAGDYRLNRFAVTCKYFINTRGGGLDLEGVSEQRSKWNKQEGETTHWQWESTFSLVQNLKKIK